MPPQETLLYIVLCEDASKTPSYVKVPIVSILSVIDFKMKAIPGVLVVFLSKLIAATSE